MNADLKRRDFLGYAGKGLGLATLTSSVVASLFNDLNAATRSVEHLSPEAAAADEDFWATIQQSFYANRSIVNLNNGGVSPSPKMVTEAFCNYTWKQDDVPPYTMWQIMEPQTETVRKGLAAEFGCDPEEMAITRNASESLEIALFGMDLKPFDEVLTTTQDYPRMITSLKQRERREGIVLKQIKIPVPLKSMDEAVDAFAKAITPKTRVILVSHIINLTGQILPIKEICELGRSKGIEVVVDGAHAFGQFDFKLKDLGCDYYGTSLHKWLYAPKGTGFLFVKKEKIEKLWSLMGTDEKQKGDIRKYEEIGTHSAAMKLAIGESLLFHQGMGAKRKEARLRYIRDYWANKLKDIPNIRFNTNFDKAHSCCVTNVQVVGQDQGAIGGYLMGTHKILTTPIIHDEFQGIRITPNVYTTLPELDRFCDVMTTIAKNGVPKS